MQSTRHRIVAVGLALVSLALSNLALADDEFDIRVSGRTVIVTAKGEWHINRQYHWRLVSDGASLVACRVALTDRQATLAGVPPGRVQLKGGVCTSTKCKTFERELHIQQ